MRPRPLRLTMASATRDAPAPAISVLRMPAKTQSPLSETQAHLLNHDMYRPLASQTSDTPHVG